MKIITFCLFGILLIQSSLAHPSAKPNPERIEFDLEHIDQGVGDGISGAIEFGGDLALNLANDANDLTQTDIEAGLSLRDFTDYAKNGLKKLGDKIKKNVSRFTNRIIGRVADQVRDAVADLEERAQKLLAKAEMTLDDIKMKVDERVQIVQDSLNNWADKKMQENSDADDETKEKINEILDDVVDAGTALATECGNSLIEPVENLNIQAKNLVESSFPLIDDLVNQIEDCASLDQKNLKITSKCAAELKIKLKKLVPLPGQYAKLLRQLNRVVIGSVNRAPCVAVTVVKVDKLKTEAKKKIAELLDGDNSGRLPTSTTESSPESSSEESSKESSNEESKESEETTSVPESNESVPEEETPEEETPEAETPEENENDAPEESDNE